MITKEEYQKTIVRMWDSIRGDNSRGAVDCDGVLCIECPMCERDVCNLSKYNAYDMIAIVEEWGKEHPIKTNGIKFLETYPNANVCGYRDSGKILYIRLDNSKPSNADDNRIEVPAEWWNKEVE